MNEEAQNRKDVDSPQETKEVRGRIVQSKDLVS